MGKEHINGRIAREFMLVNDKKGKWVERGCLSGMMGVDTKGSIRMMKRMGKANWYWPHFKIIYVFFIGINLIINNIIFLKKLHQNIMMDAKKEKKKTR